MEYEIMSRVELVECERNMLFIHAEMEFFGKKYKIRALKLIVLALKLYTASFKSAPNNRHTDVVHA